MAVSMATLSVLSRCQLGVMRKVTGQYDGFCQIGESRSFINWYPLSLKFCPKTFSFGQVSWHAEHGNPYLRAKAGIAVAFCSEPRQTNTSRNSPATALRAEQAMRKPPGRKKLFFFFHPNYKRTPHK